MVTKTLNIIRHSTKRQRRRPFASSNTYRLADFQNPFTVMVYKYRHRHKQVQQSGVDNARKGRVFFEFFLQSEWGMGRGPQAKIN